MSNNKSIRITVASCLLIVSMVAGLFVYSTISPKELTAEEYKQIGFYKLVRTRQINNFELVEGDNKFSNNDLVGAWDVLFLGFASCPDMCPMTMKKMAMANSNLSEEVSSKVKFRMISVDPDRDTPEKMQEYAKAFAYSCIFSGVSRSGSTEIILNFTFEDTSSDKLLLAIAIFFIVIGHMSGHEAKPKNNTSQAPTKSLFENLLSPSTSSKLLICLVLTNL